MSRIVNNLAHFIINAAEEIFVVEEVVVGEVVPAEMIGK